MTPRGEYFSALWSGSTWQYVLVALSALLSFGVFVVAFARMLLMDKSRAASMALIPLDVEQEENHG